MVLGNSLAKWVAVQLLLASCGPAATEETVDSATFGGHQLTIIESDGNCSIRTSEGAPPILLGVGVPCRFQKAAAELQIYTFPEFGGLQVAVAVGTPVSEEIRRSYKLAEEETCFGNAQGLAADTDGVAVTSTVTRDGVWCSDIGMDRKFFFDFAEDFHKSKASE